MGNTTWSPRTWDGTNFSIVTCRIKDRWDNCLLGMLVSRSVSNVGSPRGSQVDGFRWSRCALGEERTDEHGPTTVPSLVTVI